MFRACDQRFDLTGTLKNFYELNKARICDGVVHFWLRPDLNLSFFFIQDRSQSILPTVLGPTNCSLSLKPLHPMHGPLAKSAIESS